MSRTTVYYIEPTVGRVTELAETHNPHASTVVIWRHVAERCTPPEVRAAKHEYEWRSNPDWNYFSSPLLNNRERILYGFTFDSVWVARENVPLLVDALEWLWPIVRFQKDSWPPFKMSEIADTIPRLIAILRTVPADARGVCFQQTSVAETIWQCRVPHKCSECGKDHEPDGEYDYHMFAFDEDERNGIGGKPYELLDAIAKTMRGEPYAE